MRKTILTIGLLLACATIAGCGGDEGDEGGSATSGSDTATGNSGANAGSSDQETSSGADSEFARQANTICKQASRKILVGISTTEVKDPSGEPDRQASNVKVIETVLVPSLEEEVRKIGALEIPSENEQEVEAFLAATTQITEDAKSQPSAWSESGSPYAAAERRAAEAGIEECPVTSVAVDEGN